MLTCLQLGYGGRLCNQMFQIAGVIGLAKKFGHDYAFPCWKNHEHQIKFGSNEDIDVQSWFKNKLPLLTGTIDFLDYFIEFNTKDENIHLPASDNFNIGQQFSGHLQSEKYFAHCKDIIKHYFEFDTEKIFKHIDEMAFLWLYDAPCGIHLRVGDYAKADSMQPVLSISYYAAAMNRFPPSTPFIIFSDDPDAAKKMFRDSIIGSMRGTNLIYIQDNHYMVDLYLMTQCKNFIIGNSTYSWWGAWLINNPDKKIIAPSTWWTDKARKEWGYGTLDLFPKEWIVI